MPAQFTYLDIGILAVLFIFMIIGFKKGFIDTILGLVGGIVSLVAAIFLAGKVADMITPLFGMGDAIHNSVYDFLFKLLNPTNDPANVYTTAIGSQESIGNLVYEAIAKLGLPDSFTSTISTSISGAISNAIANSEVAVITEKSLVEILSPVVTRVIMLIIAAILTFIVIRIVIAIIEAVAKAILRTSRSLRSLNGLLGGIFGIVKGALIVVIIFTLGFFLLSGVDPESEATDIKTEIRRTIDNSQIANYIYQNNPLPKLITDNINFDDIIGNILGILPGNNNDATPTPTPEPTPTVEPTETPESI